MYNPSASPFFPSIHLSDISPNPYTPQFDTRNRNIGAEMQRRAAERAEGRARRAEEDSDSDFESDDSDDYDEDSDDRCDYEDQRTRPEAVFFRREQDDLEIAHKERRVAEAIRALKDAKRDLRETRMRIKDRKREERQQRSRRASRSRVNLSVPSVDESTSQQRYLSPVGGRSRPPTPQPQSSLPPRSRSPSPYRFVSRPESEIPTLPSQPSPRSRSRTPNPSDRKEEGSEASQEQVYESFSKIHDLAKDFQTLKQNFVYPSVIEFQKPGSQEIITVRTRSPPGDDDETMSVDSEDRWSEGKLAYTRTNEGLHAYSYAMEKLLGKLDSVDSWNETSVRTKRRGIIGEIEEEASKLERYRQKVWRDYCAKYVV